MDLKFTEKAIFYQKGRFSRRLATKTYNILIWRMRMSQNLDCSFFFCDDPFRIFSCPFSFLFLGLLSSLPFALRILSGRRKKLGVNYEQSLEIGP